MLALLADMAFFPRVDRAEFYVPAGLATVALVVGGLWLARRNRSRE